MIQAVHRILAGGRQRRRFKFWGFATRIGLFLSPSKHISAASAASATQKAGGNKQ
jgi:hypothetical protein